MLFLREFRIFKHCSASNLEYLMEHTRMLNVKRGTVMYKCGDALDGVYLIKDGWFEVTRPARLQGQEEHWLEQKNIDPIAKI